jgi:isoleucyl-tRNA synthetase
VHLTDWPDAGALPADDDLVGRMDRVRDVCSAALSLREARGLRVRLPLQRLTVAGRHAAELQPYAELIATELNVKAVTFAEDLSSFGSFRLQPNGRVLGPKLGGDVQKVIKAAKEGAWEANADGTVTVAGHVLADGEFDLALLAHEGEATAALRGNDTVVNLDTTVTDELRAEGTARDLIRLVQQARKDADLKVTDRIRLTVQGSGALAAVVDAHRDSIAAAVLATDLQLVDDSQPTTAVLEGSPVSFRVDVVQG